MVKLIVIQEILLSSYPYHVQQVVSIEADFTSLIRTVNLTSYTKIIQYQLSSMSIFFTVNYPTSDRIPTEKNPGEQKESIEIVFQDLKRQVLKTYLENLERLEQEIKLLLTHTDKRV